MMMKKEHLHLLIHEEVYRIDQNQKTEEKIEVKEAVPIQEENEPNQQQEQPVQEHKKNPNNFQKAPDESPESHIIPLAIFHETDLPDDIKLLQKIITACKLKTGEYQVFANGFNQKIIFEKALVFVPKAKVFYKPIPHQKSQTLCSKPLNELVNNSQEKSKLWTALKQFIQ